jgi:hypothetical protein
VGFRLARVQFPGTDIRAWATADLTPFISTAGRWWPPLDLALVSFWGAVKVGAEQREGVAFGGWHWNGPFTVGEESFRGVPAGVFEQQTDGTLAEATGRLLGDPMTNGAGSVIAHDFKGDGREDLLFPGFNESPFIAKPSTAWVTRPDGSFERITLSDNVMSHDARLVTLGGVRQVIGSSYTGQNLLYRWGEAGFIVDDGLEGLGGMSVVADTFGDGGEEWIVVGDAWWVPAPEPWPYQWLPMLTYAYRFQDGVAQVPPTLLPKPYFNDKPEYANFDSGWDPVAKSHVSRLWVTDRNQDGRLDILAGTEIFSDTLGVVQSVFQVLINDGGEGATFSDETDALGWEYRKDSASIDYSVRLRTLTARSTAGSASTRWSIPACGPTG